MVPARFNAEHARAMVDTLIHVIHFHGVPRAPVFVGPRGVVVIVGVFVDVAGIAYEMVGELAEFLLVYGSVVGV